MRARASNLFVGMGNILRCDDGVGVRAAEVLGSLALPDDIEVYDAGGVGLDAAPMLEDRRLVVAVDGLDTGGEPGAVYRLSPDDLRPLVRTGLSLHDVHLLDALDETRLLGRAPDRVVVFGVQVEEIGPGLGLTPRVERGLRRVLPLVLREFGLDASLLHAAQAGTAWAG